jgi:hypothetical protein
MEQTVVSIGCTSVENLGLMPEQEKVIAPPPGPPPGVVSLLLHAINDAEKKIIRMIAKDVFIK